MTFFPDKPALVEGAIYEYEERLWRCGLVNQSRARLDPLQGERVRVGGGHAFTSYGSSVNIGPCSGLRRVDESELTTELSTRNKRLSHIHQPAEGEDTMATAQVAGTPVAPSRKVKSPVAATPVGKVQRVAKTATAGAVAKNLRRPAQPAQPVELSPCKCGCGAQVAKHFYAGHDARFKGWLLQIERGKIKKEEVLSAAVINAYKWVGVKGGGERPTTNYKGEKHAGYETKVAGE